MVRVGRWFAAAWRHRRDAAALATFDDRMLADIGLTRCDLRDALSEPLWRDPTVVLAHRYCERRRVRRAVAAELIKRASPPLVPGADTFSLPPRDPPARLTL
jgi:uncharacterized protein YjiS (DUF1127 family)